MAGEEIALVGVKQEKSLGIVLHWLEVKPGSLPPNVCIQERCLTFVILFHSRQYWDHHLPLRVGDKMKQLIKNETSLILNKELLLVSSAVRLSSGEHVKFKK